MKDNKKWVTLWGNAVSIAERRPENYAKDITLRYPVRMTLDGEAIRITLDNFCGNEDITITCGNIALSTGEDRIDPETMVKLTFNGKESVTIPIGERVKSDPVAFPVKHGGDMAVSLYLGEFTKMRSGVLITGPLSRGYFALGNKSEDGWFHPDYTKRLNMFYFLSDIEVLTDSNKRTIICYGDSITAQAWPDYFIMKSMEKDPNTAVIRKAASGTRVLRQYDNITYDSYGLKGETRFPHEVLSVSGADTVIIQHGINDIIHPVGVEENRFRPWSDLPTVQELIDGLRFYIREAKKQGLKVYLGTLLPIKGWRTYADFRDELRCAVNDWMRTTDEADGCIDFDSAVCDPEDKAKFRDDYDSGDHLHPSAKAYERMAEEAVKVIFGE